MANKRDPRFHKHERKIKTNKEHQQTLMGQLMGQTTETSSKHDDAEMQGSWELAAPVAHSFLKR